jgi:hypothetical protein
MKKTEKSKVKHKEVRKLTPAELKKVSGGPQQQRDCWSPDQATCLAYIVVGP